MSDGSSTCTNQLAQQLALVCCCRAAGVARLDLSSAILTSGSLSSRTAVSCAPLEVVTLEWDFGCGLVEMH